MAHPSATRTSHGEVFGFANFFGSTLGPAFTSPPCLVSWYQVIVATYSPGATPSPLSYVEK